MKNIDSELEKAGAEFRRAGDAISDQPWDASAKRWGLRRPVLVLAASAAAVLLLALPMMLLGGGGGSADPESPATGVTEPPVQEVASTVTAAPAPSTTAPLVGSTFADPPHLLLETEGWEMVGYYESTHEPHRSSQAPLVFRPPGAEIGEATFLAGVFEPTENISWSAGSNAERIALDGRTVSVFPESVFPVGHTAGVEFADGTLVVAEAYAMTRAEFVEAVKQITLDAAGGAVVTPPPGYEQVVLPAPYSGTVTYRQAQYAGPDHSGAEVRTWSGTLADVELDAFGRIQEAQSVRTANIDGAAVVVADHSDDMSRVWIVGGADGYVIEIDFNSLGAGTTDADLDAILSQIRRVDLVTFEAALPEGSVSSETMADVVSEILADIPQPTGFDASAIGSTGDRYQVGAGVVSAVTCAWIDQWIDATAAGDAEREAEAVDALLSSKGWSILLEMQSQGGFSDVVWEYADGVAQDGTVIGGRVLTVEESYKAALGCS